MNAAAWNRRVLALILMVSLPLAVVLMFSLRGFVRESILIPLSYLGWIAGLLIRSTPQALFWFLMLAAGLIIAIRSLSVKGRPVEGTGEEVNHIIRRQRVGFWIFQTRMAREGFSRARFADFFSRLALETLAFREQVTPAEAEARLQQGHIAAPPELLGFIKLRRLAPAEGVGLLGWLLAQWNAWRNRLAGGETTDTPSADNELEPALRYLEDQLEVKHDV